MNDRTQMQAYADSIYEASSLKNIRRAHAQLLVGTNPGDTIAAHCYLTAVIGWILADMAHTDPFKVCAMCVFHDFEESRSGDQAWVHKRYVIVDDKKIHDEQFSGFTASSPLKALMEEYKERESLNAQLAKDADLLAQVVLLREYACQGNREADRQLKGRKKDGVHLLTQEAKDLNKALYERDLHEWWVPLAQKERRTE